MAVTLRNKTYDRLKHVTQIVLPGLGSLYFGLAAIWDLPYGEQVVGSTSVLTIFFGVVLGLSSQNYDPEKADPNFAGDFVVEKRPDGRRTVQLELAKDPRSLVDREVLTFKVVDKSEDAANEHFWDPSAE